MIAHESAGQPGAYGYRPPRDRLALVRICAHYFSHPAWLDAGALLHGARQLGASVGPPPRAARPVLTARDRPALARAWPGAELVIVQDAGTTGSPRVGELLRRAYRTSQTGRTRTRPRL